LHVNSTLRNEGTPGNSAHAGIASKPLPRAFGLSFLQRRQEVLAQVILVSTVRVLSDQIPGLLVVEVQGEDVLRKLGMLVGLKIAVVS